MSFQAIIDNAASIGINSKKRVAQTQSRDGIIRTTSVGGQAWEFDVRLPDGPRWSDMRGLIAQAEGLDRVTSATIQINSPGHAWLSEYQGDVADPNTITVSYTSGNTVTITSTHGLVAGEYHFRAGDFVQLGTGKVYSVVGDVAHNETVVTLNRPVREIAGSYTLSVGQSVSWNVICVQFPQWNIFARDQVSWDGSFVFAEVI